MDEICDFLHLAGNDLTEYPTMLSLRTPVNQVGKDYGLACISNKERLVPIFHFYCYDFAELKVGLIHS